MITLRLAMLPLMLALSLMPAFAQERGKSCRSLTPIEQHTTWWGRFSGGRETTGLFDGGGIEYHTEEACFPDRKTCERWLYLLKSDYGYMPRWNECSQGYQPDKPVQQW